MDNKTKTNNSWPLTGNSHVADFLERSLINNKIVSAYIFLGPDDLGKTSFARHFSRLLLCGGRQDRTVCGICESCRQFGKFKNFQDRALGDQAELNFSHSDFYILKRQSDKKNISVESTRQFIRSLSMSSFLKSYKVGVIKDAHLLSIEAANALLKTLEEPKEKVVIILTASCMDLLPATIASRSQILNFYPVSRDLIYRDLLENHQASRSQAKNLSRLCLGRPALALKLFYDEDFLSNYLRAAENFLEIFQADLIKRGECVQALIGQGKADREGVREALAILDIWQGVARDMMLTGLGRKDLIQFEILSEKIADLPPKKMSASNIVNVFKILNENIKYLKSNVSPKMAFENIAFNV